MVYTKNMEKNKYVQELSGYKILLTKNQLWDLNEIIHSNKSVTPEMIGYLIGSATPTFVNALCPKCSQEILVEEEYQPEESDFMDLHYDKNKKYHHQCYLEVKKDRKPY